MRKRYRAIVRLTLLLGCSLLLVSCDAIAAQHISRTDSVPGANGGFGGMRGGPGAMGRDGNTGGSIQIQP